MDGSLLKDLLKLGNAKTIYFGQLLDTVGVSFGIDPPVFCRGEHTTFIPVCGG